MAYLENWTLRRMFQGCEEEGYTGLPSQMFFVPSLLIFKPFFRE